MNDSTGYNLDSTTVTTSLTELLDEHVTMSTTVTFEDAMMATWQYRLAKQIPLYCSPLVVLVGTIGNLLSLLVLLRPSMRTRSTFLYLAGVAAADLVFLYVHCFRRWVVLVSGERMARYNWVCKSVCFLGGVSSHYSVWLIVLVTVERLIVISNTLKAAVWCQRKRTLVAMAVLLGVILAINAHALWTYGIVTHPDNIECQDLPEYSNFAEDVWSWIDSSIYSLVPFPIIFTVNIFIIMHIQKAARMRRTMSSSNPVDDGSKRLTKMLLTLSFTFLLTTLPMCIFLIYYNRVLADDNIHHTPVYQAEIKLATTVCQHIMWINHAINFFLYCLVGKKFRQEFLMLLRCQWVLWPSHSPDTIQRES